MTEPMRDLPPLEISAPDISPYRAGNTGIPYVTTWDSGQAGLHVLINAVTHGNELCGAHTLDFLFREEVRPVQGKLTLSFANVAAFQSFDAADPFASRFVDEDFNRVWTPEILQGSRDSVELRRARELAALFASSDLLLDIHSMHLASPPLMMCGMQQRAVDLSRAMGIGMHMIRDEGHASGRRMRDYGVFDDPEASQTALLVECGQHWAQSSVDVAIDSTLRFLRASGVVAPGWAEQRLSADSPLPAAVSPPGQQGKQVVEVSGPITISSEDFRFVEDYTGMEVIPKAGTVIGYDGNQEVRTPYDDCVLVMPGRNLRQGLSAVRLGRFVD